MEENRELKKPKILIVHNYYQIPGGEDTVVSNEKKLLEDNGHEVFLYTRNNNELNEMGKLKKLLLPFTTIFNFRTIRDVTEIIKNNGIDVVHVHNTLNLISPSVYYAALHCRTPVVQTMHNFRMLCPGATFYRDGKICEDCTEKGLGCAIKHSCYRNSKLQTFACVLNTLIHRVTGIYKKINFICLTDFNKEKLLLLNKKRQVVDSSKIFVKPNFTFEVSGKKSASKNYYLYIGRLEEIKGVDLLLEAFSHLKDENLKIAGTGTRMEYYKKNATANVEFLGFLNREELRAQLSGAKALIVSSQWYETFGMIVAEAYAARCPVIVGDIGNVSNLVDEGVTGKKFEYNNADSLVSVITNFECDELMGEKAYDKYLKDFSPEANYKILLDIYNKI